MTDSNLPVPAQSSVPMVFGSSNLDARDFIPPRVKILQPMSKEATEGQGDPGDFFNTLTSENYGPTLQVVPITPLKQRVFLFRDLKRPAADTLLANAGLSPMPEGEGLMCRSLDMLVGVGHPGDELAQRTLPSGYPAGCPQCPFEKWRPNREPPLCTETYNVVALTLEGDLVIVSMAKSGAKAGKRFFSMLMLTRPGQRPWSKAYELSTSKQSNKQGTWWAPEVRQVPEPPPTDIMRGAAEWYPSFTGRVIDVTEAAMETATEEDDTDTTDDTADLSTAKF